MKSYTVTRYHNVKSQTKLKTKFKSQKSKVKKRVKYVARAS